VDETVLSDLKEHLKGSDATVKRACDLLSLAVSIKAVFFNEVESGTVLLDQAVNIDYRVNALLAADLEINHGGQMVSEMKGETWGHRP
jgi:hypothetical protein